MVNVYGQVEKFYNEYMDAEHVLPMDIVERYLRKNAWHGSEDNDLKGLWDILRIALLYVMETKLYALETLIPSDYQEIAYRIGRFYPILFSAKTVVVGNDIRLSGPALKKSLIKVSI